MRQVLLGLVLGACVSAAAQTHAVKKPEQVVRAVALYEWTGEEAKPTASRVVPVSLFIEREFRDAAEYLPQPVPFALQTGVVYEARKSGVDEGTIELAYERHVTTTDTVEIDDGWMAYGKLKVKPPEVTLASAKAPLHPVAVNGETKPHFGTKSATPDTVSDPDAPVLVRRQGSGSDPSPSTAPATAGSTQTPASTAPGASGTSSQPASSDDSKDDPADRPTLKRRTPAERKVDQKKKGQASVTAGSDLNDDPDRPTLHRGSATMTDEQAIPPLRGLPADMHQMVAVSDAKGGPEHDFRRQWASPTERADVREKMEAFARTQLAAYKGVAAAASPAPATPAPATPRPQTAAARAAAAKAKKAASKSTLAPVALADEELKGYALSYGGAATYIYTANSPGTVSGVTRYITMVAQDDPTTGLKLALASVTDSTHLDRTPWMRFVDVVDADGSNRASLLMELRAQHTRQFALYRVIGAQADQVFLTGSTQ